MKNGIIINGIEYEITTEGVAQGTSGCHKCARKIKDFCQDLFGSTMCDIFAHVDGDERLRQHFKRVKK